MIAPTFKIESRGGGVYDRLRADMKELHGSFVKVGFPEGAPVGAAKKKTPGDKAYSDMSEVARIAVWNEFGATIKHPGGTSYRNMAIGGRIITRFIKKSTANFFDRKTGAHTIVIPERPFFRTAIDTNRAPLKDLIEKVKDDMLLGKITPKQALERIGIFMQGKIRRSLISGNWKPNAKSTIKRKGSSRPLVDTSQLVNSTTFTTHGAGEPCEREGSKVL
jgi:hypothetical protein